MVAVREQDKSMNVVTNRPKQLDDGRSAKPGVGGVRVLRKPGGLEHYGVLGRGKLSVRLGVSEEIFCPGSHSVL